MNKQKRTKVKEMYSNPSLKKHSGRQHSIKVEMFQTGSEQNKLLDTPFRFRRYGAAGIAMSEHVRVQRM